jgi:hypothetical protein
MIGRSKSAREGGGRCHSWQLPEELLGLGEVRGVQRAAGRARERPGASLVIVLETALEALETPGRLGKLLAGSCWSLESTIDRFGPFALSTGYGNATQTIHDVTLSCQI